MGEQVELGMSVGGWKRGGGGLRLQGRGTGGGRKSSNYLSQPWCRIPRSEPYSSAESARAASASPGPSRYVSRVTLTSMTVCIVCVGFTYDMPVPRERDDEARGVALRLSGARTFCRPLRRGDAGPNSRACDARSIARGSMTLRPNEPVSNPSRPLSMRERREFRLSARLENRFRGGEDETLHSKQGVGVHCNLCQFTNLDGTCVHVLLVAGTVIAAQMSVCGAAIDCGMQVSLGPAPQPLMERAEKRHHSRRSERRELAHCNGDRVDSVSIPVVPVPVIALLQYLVDNPKEGDSRLALPPRAG